MRQSTRNKKPRLLHIAFAIIFLLIGFFTGLFTNYHLGFKFQFRDTIEPAAFLSVVCTLILAWIVSTVWNRQQHAETSSKEVLIKRLEELHTFNSELAVQATSNEFFYTDATSGIKR